MYSVHKNKSVISIADHSLSYLTLEKKPDGFSIIDHEIIELPEGIVSEGHILKADVLYKILKKIADKIKNKNIDLILDQELFVFSRTILDENSKKQSLKKRIKTYFKNHPEKQSWQDTHVCEFSLHPSAEKEHVLFTCLPVELQSGYTHIFKKAGFSIGSFAPSLKALGHFCTAEKELLVHIDKNAIRVIEYMQGMYVSHKTFASSYPQFIKDILKNITLSEDHAKNILAEHGFLRSHKDEKVYKQLIRSLSPLIQFMTQKKAKRFNQISVIFADYPLPGFTDLLQKNFNVPTRHLDILTTEKYSFQEVLSLHKNETYPYQISIAQALQHWSQ